MRPRILFIGGSLNQTTMLHAIARDLALQADCTFTPYYADGMLGYLAERGVLDFTALGGRHRQKTETYLREQRLPVDFGGRHCDYDLVVTCSDLIVQNNVRGRRMVLVQEGMMEPTGPAYYGVRYLGLPRYLANTAATGLSDAYDAFCVASPGYRLQFIRRGIRPDKILVTGIPNFDNAHSFCQNDFPHRDTSWRRPPTEGRPSSRTIAQPTWRRPSASPRADRSSSNCIRRKTSGGPGGRSTLWRPRRASSKREIPTT